MFNVVIVLGGLYIWWRHEARQEALARSIKELKNRK